MSLKILLINPSVNPASQNKIVNALIANVLPTSLGLIGAYLEKKGIPGFEIIDEQIDFITDDRLRVILSSENSPSVVGFSVLTINSKRAYDLAAKIKNIKPSVITVMGGIHPTVLPEEALLNGADIVVRGEGEETFYEILENLKSGKDTAYIKGISFLKNGKPVHNPDRPLLKDLDEIPQFPFRYFEKNIHRYNSFSAVLTSRGCPFNCSFCSSRSISGRGFRYHSIDRVISEMTLLADKYNQKVIWFLDDNPAANPARFMQLLDKIIETGLHKKVEFHGSIRGDNASDRILGKAKEANFKMLAFGLETTSERLMKMIDKGETVEEVFDAIRRTDKIGIKAAATLIFGIPSETRADRRRAINDVKSLPLSSVRFNTLTPYPGTPVYDKLKKENKLLIKKDWENFAVQYMWESDDIPYVPDGNNRYELLFDTMYANLSYYISFSGIKRMIRSSFAGGNVVKLKDRWYLSPVTVFRLFRLALYLSTRFTCVYFKMLIRKK